MLGGGPYGDKSEIRMVKEAAVMVVQVRDDVAALEGRQGDQERWTDVRDF